MPKPTLREQLDTAKQRIADLETAQGHACPACPEPLEDLAFENAPGGMAVATLSGTIMACNRDGAAMIGLSVEELKGTNTKDIYANPEDRTNLDSILGAGHTIRDQELSLRHADGSIVWINFNARPIRYEDQDSALVTFVNITSLKQAQSELTANQEELELRVQRRTADLESANRELDRLNQKLIRRDLDRARTQKALEESEGLFRALFENNHAVMLLIEPKTGQIKHANPAAANYYGYSTEHLQRMTIADINILTADEIEEEMHRARKEKRNIFYFRHQLASGEIRHVEVFSGPVVVHGKQYRYAIVHDISGRRQAEEKLQRFERIIASTPDLISLVDRQYTYRMVNDAYLKRFNKPREDIVNKPLVDLLGSEFFETSAKPNLDMAFSGETIQSEHSLEVADIGTTHFSVTYQPVTNADGVIDFVSITATDITERKQHEEALKTFSDRLALATDAGKIGIWELDVETGSIIWDEMMLELYRVKEAEFSAMYDAWRTRIHPEDLAKVEQELAEAIKQNRPFDSEYRIVWPDNQIRHIKAAALVQFVGGTAKRVTGVNWDVTKKRRLEAELRRLATTDALTGANNRRSFMERAGAEIMRSKRYNSPVAILSLDIDHFKRVNDTYGHPVGDKVLKALVTICKDTLRSTDIFARMGGEEFSAILPESDVASAHKTAERLREAVEKSVVRTETDAIRYTISIGISTLAGADDHLDLLMRRADKALYKAKEQGRNRVEIE